MDSPQSARSASKTLDSIEQIRLNRERRREGIEQARQARLQQEQLEQHEVDRAAAFIAKQRPAREALKHKSLGRSGSLGALKPPRYGLEFRKMIDDFRSSVDFGSGLSTVSADDSTLDASMHKLASPKLDSSRHLSSSSRLSVFVRKRPLTASEVHARYFDVVTMLDDETVTVHEPKTRVDLSRTIENHAFLLDAVFDEHTTSREVYESSMRAHLPSVLNGGVLTTFAYGQTGSGKTFTMNSLIEYCVDDLFMLIKRYAEEGHAATPLLVNVSYYEVYMAKIFDLLANRSELVLREDGHGVVQVVGLTERVADTAAQVLGSVSQAQQLRRTTSTQVNADSSRSHGVLQLALQTPAGVSAGKICLVDLAGSERAADTNEADKHTRLEGAEINKSLLALKECVRALDKEASHVPFRGSKLTQVLRDSFVNPKSRTVMIATVSPSSHSCEHTLNTLRYADRLKEISVKPSAVLAKYAKRPPVVPFPIPDVARRVPKQAPTQRRSTIAPTVSAQHAGGVVFNKARRYSSCAPSSSSAGSPVSISADTPHGHYATRAKDHRYDDDASSCGSPLKTASASTQQPQPSPSPFPPVFPIWLGHAPLHVLPGPTSRLHPVLPVVNDAQPPTASVDLSELTLGSSSDSDGAAAAVKPARAVPSMPTPQPAAQALKVLRSTSRTNSGSTPTKLSASFESSRSRTPDRRSSLPVSPPATPDEFLAKARAVYTRRQTGTQSFEMDVNPSLESLQPHLRAGMDSSAATPSRRIPTALSTLAAPVVSATPPKPVRPPSPLVPRVVEPAASQPIQLQLQQYAASIDITAGTQLRLVQEQPTRKRVVLAVQTTATVEIPSEEPKPASAHVSTIPQDLDAVSVVIQEEVRAKSVSPPISPPTRRVIASSPKRKATQRSRTTPQLQRIAIDNEPQGVFSRRLEFAEVWKEYSGLLDGHAAPGQSQVTSSSHSVVDTVNPVLSPPAVSDALMKPHGLVSPTRGNKSPPRLGIIRRRGKPDPHTASASVDTVLPHQTTATDSAPTDSVVDGRQDLSVPSRLDAHGSLQHVRDPRDEIVSTPESPSAKERRRAERRALRERRRSRERKSKHQHVDVLSSEAFGNNMAANSFADFSISTERTEESHTGSSRPVEAVHVHNSLHAVPRLPLDVIGQNSSQYHESKSTDRSPRQAALTAHVKPMAAPSSSQSRSPPRPSATRAARSTSRSRAVSVHVEDCIPVSCRTAGQAPSKVRPVSASRQYCVKTPYGVLHAHVEKASHRIQPPDSPAVGSLFTPSSHLPAGRLPQIRHVDTVTTLEAVMDKHESSKPRRFVAGIAKKAVKTSVKVLSTQGTVNTGSMPYYAAVQANSVYDAASSVSSVPRTARSKPTAGLDTSTDSWLDIPGLLRDDADVLAQLREHHNAARIRSHARYAAVNADAASVKLAKVRGIPAPAVASYVHSPSNELSRSQYALSPLSVDKSSPASAAASVAVGSHALLSSQPVPIADATRPAVVVQVPAQVSHAAAADSPITPLVGLLNSSFNGFSFRDSHASTSAPSAPPSNAASAMLEQNLASLRKQALEVQKVLVTRKQPKPPAVM